MKRFEIPLSPNPQRVTVDLNGREVLATFRWKETHEGGWTVDITDPATNAPLIHGLPLVAGVDLLEPYKYLGIPCRLFLGGDGQKEATRENLGKDVKLYMVVDE